MSFITKTIEKKLGVDLDGDGMIGGRRHGIPVSYNAYGQGNSGLINELEKTTNIDLNGDGRIGGPPAYRPNHHHSGSGGLVNKIERITNMDLNGDGTVAGRPNYHPNYPPYGGSSYAPPYNPPYNPYGGPSNYPPAGGAGAGMINELEKATNIDLNHDGRIGGGQPGYPPNYPPPPNPYGGPSNYPPAGGAGTGLINELEKATNIDLNHDGRIGGGQPGYPPNYPPPPNPYGGPSNYPPPLNPYGGPSNYPPAGGAGAGLINELEKATNIDLNRDGRIGSGQPGYPPNYPPPSNLYGGPPNYPPPGGPGAGLINELEKATNMDLNGDGQIGARPPYPPNYNPYGY